MTEAEIQAVTERTARAAEAVRIELQDRLSELSEDYAISHLLWGLAEFVEASEIEDEEDAKKVKAWRKVRNMLSAAAEQAMKAESGLRW